MKICNVCKTEIGKDDGFVELQIQPARVPPAQYARMIAAGLRTHDVVSDRSELDLCCGCGIKALDAIGYGLAGNAMKPIEIPTDEDDEDDEDDDEPPTSNALTPDELRALGLEELIAGTHAAHCAKAHDHSKRCDCHLAGNYRSAE
jgi:hypothetical protein